MRRYDAVVIGGGLAGCAAARELAAAGCRYVLVEAGKEIGKPVRCAEFIPKMMKSDLDLADICAAQSVYMLRTRLPDGCVHDLASPGFIVDKDRLTEALLPESSTAEILTGTRCTKIQDGRIFITGPDGENVLGARYIIGADGPRSLVGKAMGHAVPRAISALQYTCAAAGHPSDASEVLFRRDIRAGYAWYFPKNEKVNVGLGCILPGRVQRQLLDGFIAELADTGRVVPGSQTAFMAGMIPVDGIAAELVKNGMLLCGDAAGLTDPVSGGGNYPAAASGRMAGKAVVRALMAGSDEALGKYEKKIRDLFGKSQERAVRRRKEMEAGWDAENLSGLVRKTWVGFKEYYHD